MGDTLQELETKIETKIKTKIIFLFYVVKQQKQFLSNFLVIVLSFCFTFFVLSFCHIFINF